MIKGCVVCGKSFNAMGSAKTCSPECSYILHNESVRKRKWL